MIYVTLDEKNIVNGIKEVNEPINDNSHIEITQYDVSLIGKYYNNGSFINPVLSFDEQKQAKIKQLHDKYQKMYSDYLAQYPKREVDSFAVKQAEAIAYNL